MSIIAPFSHFNGTRDAIRPLERIDNIREAAKDFRKTMLSNPKVLFYKTFELIRVPYPSKYAYLNAFNLPTPFVHLCNKLFVIQFSSDEGIKTLLVSPSDWENQRDTPFFAQLDQSAGPLSKPMERVVIKETNTVLGVLQQVGLKPEDIDYISYDHLHTQNVSRWLGGNGHKALFPNAKLLVMREEWESTLALLPWQNQWYCPENIQGISLDRVLLLDDSVFLGDGSVAIMRTKGHTEGNHSIVAHTDQGLLVTSENGVSMDSYSPLYSRISGLANFAKTTGAEVIINGNTLECGNDQYLSMIQEKEVAGRWPKDERFYNMALSSESDGFWLFPGTPPTVRMGDLEFGHLTLPKR
ncbi:hypothetical protein F900_02010 [Acinetobacter modestus]|uniref:Metallo-beta-lactamase domain-containing protein n=1 Tax=Acinetobacter modestus TaxID=1776740 RepID=N9NEC1_9GAMM|nr:hypothetical protein [Acinetobacter modestus]ENX00340.1 hypothetical protein F900_02010 [Acinetobacter modestus]